MLLKLIPWFAALFFFESTAIAQYNPGSIYQKIVEIEKNNAPPGEKLKEELSLKEYYEKHYTANDSVYAFILHRVALLKTRTENLFPEAIKLTIQSAHLNLAGHPNCNPAFAVNSLFNVGYYYQQLQNYKAALLYYDSAIQYQENYPAQVSFFFRSHLTRSEINYNLSNYQESFEDAESGLQKQQYDSNAVWISQLYYRAAKALIALNSRKKVQPYIDKSKSFFARDHDSVMVSRCFIMEATMAGYSGNNTAAGKFIQQALAYVQHNADADQQAITLSEAGSIYLDIIKDFQQAGYYFGQEVALCKTKMCNDTYIATAYNNLGLIAFKKGDINNALEYYDKATNLRLGRFALLTLLQVPTMAQIRTLPGMNKLFITLGNKAELLMLHYKKNKNPLYLKTAFQAFMLADSIITEMRHNQTGETSKLYWRQLTHEVHQSALEVCSLMNDPAAAFYFMERSRSVLLNDRLNELGAGNLLHAADLAGEQDMRSQVVQKQVALSGFAEGDAGYKNAQQDFLNAQEKLNRYIGALEQKFPAYYQYKYADEVQSVQSLQQYLKDNKRQFVEYFSGDTILYILYADGKQMQLFRQRIDSADKIIHQFLLNCSDKNYQNKLYSAFLQSSWQLYHLFLNSLALKPGSVIISPDKTLFPFDILCSDTASKKLLVEDFAFSYTYSARFLLKPLPQNKTAKGNFLGMAPVGFPVSFQLATLTASRAAVEALQQYYPDAKIAVDTAATRGMLLKNLSGYRIVNLYTHANGTDSTEPQLYMADSVVHLSELQIMEKPATQLIILSACQTNSGKQADGEGIYSIARGFAMAGIPAAIATLWKADEQATYFITGEFHKNISQGMAKDIALQQAKLTWLKQADREHSLPFYWANLTLMGNADAIVKPAHTYWWFIAAALVLLLVIAFAWQRYKQRVLLKKGRW